MARNMRKRKKGRKRQRNRWKPSQWLWKPWKPFLKSLGKNVQRDPGEKRWACYYCGREGHLKRNCPQASKPPWLPVWSAKDHTGRDAAPRGVGFSRQSGLKVPRGPHTSSHPNYTWGIPGINNHGRPIHWFPFRYWGNLLWAYWSPWPTFSRSASIAKCLDEVKGITSVVL